MNSIVIKVLLSDNNIIYRDMQLNKNADLIDLHESILDAFGFSGNQMANFTKFDESLSIASEYHLERYDENTNLMKDFKVKDLMEEVGDILEYTYDFLNQWEFSLEIIDLKEEIINEKYKLIKSFGDSPKEADRNSSGEDAEEFLRNALVDQMMNEEEEDEWMDEDKFDSLDDYEEFQ